MGLLFWLVLYPLESSEGPVSFTFARQPSARQICFHFLRNENACAALDFISQVRATDQHHLKGKGLYYPVLQPLGSFLRM